MDTLWSALIGGAGGAVVAAIASFWQSWLTASVKVDEALRERREKDYLTLWSHTRLLPKWPKEPVTYAAVADLSGKLRTWYFDGGGLYLSAEARTAYGAAQEALTTVVAAAKDPARDLTDKDYDRLQKALSALRTELTRDLLSRERRTLRLLG